MEGTGLVGEGGKVTSVNQDAESWSKLDPGICDMILEKLPSWELQRLRVVCKDWNCSPLKRVEHKPYFVIIVKSSSSREYLSGLVLYNVVSKSVSFEQLPIKLQTSSPEIIPPFAVEGLIFSNHPMGMNFHNQKEWCVFNIHNGTMHVLPQPPSASGFRRGSTFVGSMMVDTFTKPHTFKLLVSYTSGGETQVYNSASRSWSLLPKANPNSNSSLSLAYDFCAWCFCMCHKGCMYMCTEKAVDGVLVYSMEEDQWSKLSGSPFRGKKRTYLGAWDDRIFPVLRDAGDKSLTVWELVDGTQQEWVEFARCSDAEYEQLMDYDRLLLMGISKCEIVSVFSEEYVLMYNLHEGRILALTVLNLKSKEWEPVASTPNMIKMDN